MTEKQYIKLLGERISEKRHAQKISVAVLAKKVKLSRMQIYRIEQGEGPTTITVLLRIAKVLNMPLRELVNP